MKLLLRFHETSELQTVMTADEAEERLEAAIGGQFTGKRTEEGFQIAHKDVNPFRPEITVTLHPGDEGVLAVADMKLHPGMLAFLCVWSVIVIAIAVWRNWLLLVMLPVFWLIALIAFSIGVSSAKNDLLTTLDAAEVIG